MKIEYFIEVPNTNIKEPVDGFCYDLLYDMASWLYYCRESEVIKNEFLIKLEHTLDEQFYNKFVKQNVSYL